GAGDSEGRAAGAGGGGAWTVREQVEDTIDRGGNDAREGDGDGANGGAQRYGGGRRRHIGFFLTTTPQRRGEWGVVLEERGEWGGGPDGANRAFGTAPQRTTPPPPRFWPRHRDGGFKRVARGRLHLYVH